MRGLLIAMAALAVVACAVPGAAAQDVVRISGRVVENESSAPIPAVDVTVRTADDRFLRSAITDDDGRFQVLVRGRVQAITLYASRIGFSDNRTPLLWFDGHDFFNVEIRLDPEAILLAPLEVLARSGARSSPVLAGFRHRLDSGTGYYITRDDIDRRRPMYITDMLAEVPGVRLTSSGSGSRRTISMSRGTRQVCPVQVFMDGRLLTAPIRTRSGTENAAASIDDFVSPLSVEGIEVYRGLSTVPAEFMTPDAQCGVVAIWTRRGG